MTGGGRVRTAQGLALVQVLEKISFFFFFLMMLSLVADVENVVCISYLFNLFLIRFIFFIVLNLKMSHV